ncbi:hypothetical protein E3N88_40148 [Mikania micrantha]|uniref:Uncharacterized protein n=1 Tax=Mikania micrantha TaxID=192012 RepID=A0A5N6LMP2_9ASTR|nr:hypothetical protein E3N88_40148 [Mikania micrantha]
MANDGDEANMIASGFQTVPTQQSPQKSTVNDGDATEMLPISQLEEQSVQKDQTQKNEEPIQANDKDKSDSDKPIKEFLKPNKERKQKLKLKAKKVDKLKEAGSKRKIETSQQAEKVKLKKLKGNIEKSEENQSPYFEYTGQKIFMRCSPANLINFLEKLNEDQKKAVKEMGFGEVLCLKLHTIPTAFGYWLLKNYNPQTDIQNIGSSQFKITPDLIHLVFGIPNGKITVHEKFRPNSNDAVVSEWRSQFGTDIPKKISMKDFAQHLTTRNDSGRMFKLNFLVMFFSIMGESMKSNTVNQRFLTSVTTKMDMKKLSWCDYVLTCLRKTRQTWNGGEDELFNGPLVLLAVLYFYEKQHSKDQWLNQPKKLGGINLTKLQEFEEKLELIAGNEDSNHEEKKTEGGLKVKIKIKRPPKVQVAQTDSTGNEESSKGDDKEEEVGINIDETVVEKEPTVQTEEETAQMISKALILFEEHANKVRELLAEANKLYPGSIVIKEKEKQWKTSVEKYIKAEMEEDYTPFMQPEENYNIPSISPLDLSPSLLKEFIEMEKNALIELENKALKKTVDRLFEGPSFSLLGESQETQSVEEEVAGGGNQDAVLLAEQETVGGMQTEDDEQNQNLEVQIAKVISELPLLQSRGQEYQTPEKAMLCVVDPVSSVRPEQCEVKNPKRPQRKKVLPEVLCSPYIQRQVVMADKRTSTENNLSSYIFAASGECW